jgi:hypothetical protein
MQVIIQNLEYKATDGAVICVYWQVAKSQDGFTVSADGSATLEPNPASPDFVPYEQLTAADVERWLRNLWGADELARKEAALDVRLNKLLQLPIRTGLPWAR